jgi:hypothetical protein
MTEIEIKEKEIQILKNKQNQENWEKYLTKLKIFLEKLKGKTIISWTSNGKFYIFKIINYHEKYYVDGSGFNGQWNPRRWYELETTGCLNFTVPYYDSTIHKHAPPKIEENTWFNDSVHVPFGCTKLVKIKGKKKDQIIFPKFYFSDLEMIKSCSVEINQMVTLGKLAYETNVPDYDKTVYDFFGFKQLLKNDSVFEKALEIHKEHTLKVLNFYNSFKDEFQENEYISDIFKSI